VLFVVLDLAVAVLADVDGQLGHALRPSDLSELQHLKFIAAKARHPSFGGSTDSRAAGRGSAWW
jgi:hypothetical protein